LEIGGTPFGEQIQPAYKKRFGLTKHSSAADIRALVGAVTWSKYFTFSFVRNPFARCLSTYHFLRKWDGLSAEYAQKMNAFASFDEYALSDIWEESNGPDQIFRPQIHWLRADPMSTNLLVNFVGRVEKIDVDFAYALEVIGTLKGRKSKMQLAKLNQSETFVLSDIKKTAVIEKIVDKYKIDFDSFGYSLDPIAN